MFIKLTEVGGREINVNLENVAYFDYYDTYTDVVMVSKDYRIQVIHSANSIEGVLDIRNLQTKPLIEMPPIKHSEP